MKDKLTEFEEGLKIVQSASYSSTLIFNLLLILLVSIFFDIRKTVYIWLGISVLFLIIDSIKYVRWERKFFRRF